MGEVLSKKREGNKIIYRVKTSMEEAGQLKNHMKKVHLFDPKECCKNTRIVERGNNGGAKYFQIPLELKSRRRKKFSSLFYQRVRLDKKVYYVIVGTEQK